MNSKMVYFLFGIALAFACSSPEHKGKDTNDSIGTDSVKTATDDHTPATTLPVWARKLGLREPKNMHLIKGMSHLTSAVEPREGFNSVTLVYSGNYDTAMNQARRIARAARLPQSKEYKSLSKLARRRSHANRIKGIAYMNYDFSTRDTDYLIYVKVDEKGMLKLSATDMKQLNLQLNKHKGIGNRKRRK
jgi:hypothetical protein